MSSKSKIYKLNDNLRYLHVPTKTNIISVGFVVKVGSRDEDETLNGISHFLEHMLFKKTKKRTTNKLLKELDSYGAYYNAMTTHEYTSFEIHGNKKDFLKLLDILFDMYLHPKIFKKDLEIERGVITEEYNMGLSDIDDIIYDNLFNIVFGNSGLGRPIIGTKENIQNFSRSDILNYRNIFYNYLNTVIVIMGDINPKIAMTEIEKKTKNEITTDFLNIRDKIIVKQEIPRLNLTYTDSLGQIYLLLGFRFNGYQNSKDNQMIRAKLISNILTSGSSSKLWHLLRTKLGVAYYCVSNIYQFEDNSIFYIKSAVDEKRAVESLEKILETIYHVKKGRIEDDDIKRAKRSYCNINEMTMNNPSDLFDYYTSNIIRGLEISSPLDSCSKINDVRSSSIIKSCNEMFRKDNLNLVVLGNISPKQKDAMIDLLDKWYYLN